MLRLFSWILLILVGLPAFAQPGATALVFRNTAAPACDASRRGVIAVELNEDGRPDGFKVCLRDGAGRFAWIAASQQNSATFIHSPKVGGCPVFPDNNVWNSHVDDLPLMPDSAGIIGTYGTAKLGLVPAFSLNIADGRTPVQTLKIDSGESDFQPFPLTPEMRVEGYDGRNSLTVAGGPYKTDAHVLVLRKDDCKLFEIYGLRSNAIPYHAESVAIFDLLRNDMRPDGWTSADAAGLPIWPGVLTYAELYGQGEIHHMLRFTVDKTRNSFVWPARHYASRSGEHVLPPMGSRWRLKRSFDERVCRENELSGQAFPPEMSRLLRALKHHGMILADNGLAVKISTDADARWGNPYAPDSATWKMNGWSHCVTGLDFEVVNAQPLIVNTNSAATFVK
jgi:hypothetical protein